jgi:hypothetical protein
MDGAARGGFDPAVVQRRIPAMRPRRLACPLAMLAALWTSPALGANATADRIAAKLIEHYRTTSCEDLAKERKAPKSAMRSRMEQRAAERLRQDAQLRAEFLAKVAAPIADKMLVCGFIP